MLPMYLSLPLGSPGYAGIDPVDLIKNLPSTVSFLFFFSFPAGDERPIFFFFLMNGR